MASMAPARTAPVTTARRHGIRTAVIGLGVFALGVVLLRLQVADDRGWIVVGGGTLLGAIYAALGSFQLLSGRDDRRGGVGLVGLLFVVVVGLGGGILGVGLGLPRRESHPQGPEPSPRPPQAQVLHGLGDVEARPASEPAPTAPSSTP
jgi:hypothetical protein